MAKKILPAGTEGNRLGNILADAAMLSDNDLAVLEIWLGVFRAGVEIDPDSMRSVSDADVRRGAGRRFAA